MVRGKVVLGVVAAAAVLTGLALVSLLPLSEAGLTRPAAAKPTPLFSEEGPPALQCFNYTWRRGFRVGLARSFNRGLARIEVSDEFKSNVLKILQSDADAAKLLEEGYGIAGIRPILTATVTGNGEVSWRAVRAIVTLVKDRTSFAEVMVDIGQGKVTRIITVTRSVIEKS